MARLVTVSGIDCSGKSTQIALLREALAASGADVEVRWLRPGYSTSLDALRALARRIRPGSLPTSMEPRERERIFARPGVQRAWVLVALLDVFVHYAIGIRWSLLRGRTVICDRYLEDGFLDLRLRFPGIEFGRWTVVRLLRAVAPRPAVSLLLVVPRGEMLRRMESKQEPFPDAPDLRDRRYEAYEQMVSEGVFDVVDGARPIHVVQADVRGRVEDAISRGRA